LLFDVRHKFGNLRITYVYSVPCGLDLLQAGAWRGVIDLRRIDIFSFAKKIVHHKKYGGVGASASQFRTLR